MDTAVVEHPSVCTLDCPDTCSLSVSVAGGRIAAVRGSRALPYTEGVVCEKVAHHTVQWVHGPQRLVQPLVRTGPRGSGAFRPVSWDEALDRVHEGIGRAIAAHGPQSVAPLNYAGPHGMLSGDSMSLRFFHRLGASQLYRGALCGAVRREAWAGTYGAVPGLGPEAAGAARLLVLWGNNATATNLHLVRQATQARRAGGRVVVVDPVRTKAAELADLHLALQPGTDVLLGFALATELHSLGAHDRAFIDRHVLGYEAYMAQASAWTAERAAAACGIEAASIRTLARWMAEARPLVLAPGNGLERGRNGGAGIRAAIALPALLGALDERSGIVLAAGNAFPRTASRLTRPDLLPAGGARTLNILDIGRHLAEDDLDPPLRALVIYNHNPLVVHPDQNRLRRGLSREEVFTVGIEIAMTESMAYCDVVLPAASAYECDDLYGAYGHQWLQRARPVVAPPGQAVPNTEVFRRLARRFGFDEPCFADDDAALMDQAVDAADPRLAGQRPSQLPLDRATPMTAPDGRPFALMANVMPMTPSGRIELQSELLAQRWGEHARLPAWRPRAPGALPLTLVSPASAQRISSTLLPRGGRRDEAPPLWMHPADAAARGLADGQPVCVFNALGEVVLPLRVTDAVPPGVVASEKGAWLASSPTGQTISALSSADDRADLAQGACYNDTAVEVRRATENA
jgi:anaerobic selenocysteine-containing dehydrogenase